MSDIAVVESLLLGDAHVVKVTLENGDYGLGQSAHWAYPEAVHAMFERMRPAIVGHDSRDRVGLWALLNRMAPFRGAVQLAAIAAVDIALWDLAGKHSGEPVWRLLGGRARHRIRLHALIDGLGPDALATSAAEATADGFSALKFDPLPADYFDLSMPQLVARTVECADAVRDVAPDADLIFELHRKLTPAQAIAVGGQLARLQPLFWEDPIQIDTVSTQVSVGQRVPLPYGLGERFHTIHEFRELLTQDAVHFVRPDIGLAGGFTHVAKIAAVAESHHATLCLHNCLGPLLTAASAHLAAATPNFQTLEYTTMDERLDGFVTTAWQRDGGYLHLPDAPGLGIDLVADPQPQTLVARRTHDVPRRADGSVAYDV